MAFKYKVQAGENLNSIANKYGFANYKDAGISAVPSGNFDLVRPGDEISLNNYDPNAIKPIGSTAPVISSNDTSGEFKSLGASLDSKLATGMQVTAPEAKPIDPATQPNPVAPVFNDGTGGTEYKPSGDPVYDKMIQNQDTAKAATEKWATEKKAEIDALLPKTLALLDAQYASSVTNITGTYGKLLDEQKRINAVNVDRTKAYGLGAGGQYMPLEYTSAVSDQEQKSANAIATLENERTGLLAKAKQARDEGSIATLRENMTALTKIEDTMRQRTSDLANEVQKRYELTVKVRKEQETKHQEAVTKMLDAVKIRYAKQFAEAKTEEDKAKLIRQIILDSGGTLAEKDFYNIYSSVSGAVKTTADEALKTKKAEADIASANALTDERKAAAAKNWSDAGNKKDLSKMQGALDAMTFSGDADGESKRQAFVKKYGSDGKKYWDDVFKSDTGLYTYPSASTKGNEERITVIDSNGREGTIPKSQLAEALKSGYKQK